MVILSMNLAVNIDKFVLPKKYRNLQIHGEIGEKNMVD